MNPDDLARVSQTAPRTEDGLAEEREEDRVQPDAGGQDDQGDKRETGLAMQASNCIADVLAMIRNVAADPRDTQVTHPELPACQRWKRCRGGMTSRIVTPQAHYSRRRRTRWPPQVIEPRPPVNTNRDVCSQIRSANVNQGPCQAATTSHANVLVVPAGGCPIAGETRPMAEHRRQPKQPSRGLNGERFPAGADYAVCLSILDGVDSKMRLSHLLA